MKFMCVCVVYTVSVYVCIKCISLAPDVIEEDALPVDVGAADAALRVATIAAPTARIDADDLVIPAMYHQQAVRPLRQHHKVVAVIEEYLVLVPIEVAQIEGSWH